MSTLLTVLPDMHVAAGHIGDLASALPAAGKGRWMENRDLTEKLWPATLETFAMTGVSGILTIALGLPLGLALITTGPRGQHRNRIVYEIVSQIVNIGRSMPFIILMVAIMSLTRRLVETAINDVDQGKVEAALMMGASGAQITWGVLVREALPTLIQSATVTIITLIGYSAMAGTVGGGGLGDMAIQYGYKGNESDVMIVTVVLIVIVVGIIQVCGDMLSRLVDHR